MGDRPASLSPPASPPGTTGPLLQTASAEEPYLLPLCWVFIFQRMRGAKKAEAPDR